MSSLLSELFVEIAAVYQPIGHDLEPLEVDVMSGSVEFAIGGGLFAADVGLIVACAAGIVGAPAVGVFGGAPIATIRAIDLAIDWRRKIADIRKSNMETKRIYWEARNFEFETRIKEIDYQISSD